MKNKRDRACTIPSQEPFLDVGLCRVPRQAASRDHHWGENGVQSTRLSLDSPNLLIDIFFSSVAGSKSHDCHILSVGFSGGTPGRTGGVLETCFVILYARCKCL